MFLLGTQRFSQRSSLVVESNCTKNARLPRFTVWVLFTLAAHESSELRSAQRSNSSDRWQKPQFLNVVLTPKTFIYNIRKLTHSEFKEEKCFLWRLYAKRAAHLQKSYFFSKLVQIAAIQQDQADDSGFDSHRSTIFSGWEFSQFPRA